MPKDWDYAREPVAHILGEQEFYGLTFTVTPATLIPRGDSETIVSAALECAPDGQRVLDMGTGSGALLLAFLSECRGAEGIGIDASADALAVAEVNAERLGLRAHASFRHASWHDAGWAAGLGRFDLVLCN